MYPIVKKTDDEDILLYCYNCKKKIGGDKYFGLSAEWTFVEPKKCPHCSVPFDELPIGKYVDYRKDFSEEMYEHVN